MTIVLGVGLLAMPLLSGTTSTAAAVTAYGMGALIVLAGAVAAYMEKPTGLEFIPVLLGIVLIAMPWIFQFTDQTVMAWSSWIVGVGTILASGYEAVVAPRAVPA